METNDSFDTYPYAPLDQTHPNLAVHSPLLGADAEIMHARDYWGNGSDVALAREGDIVDAEIKRILREEPFTFPIELQPKFDALARRKDKIETCLENTGNELQRISDEFNADPRAPGAYGRYFQQLTLLRVATLAREFAFIQVLKQTQRVNREEGFNIPIPQRIENDIYLRAGSTIKKIGGVSLQDIAEGKNITPVSFFHMLMEAALMDRGKPTDECYEENQGRLSQLLPATARGQIILAASEILALCFYDDSYPSVTAYLREYGDDELVVKCWESLKPKVPQLRGDLAKTLANSKSPHFAPLMELMGTYMQQNSLARDLCIFYAIGMQDAPALITSFRHFTWLAAQYPQNATYEMLQKYIREAAKAYPSEYSLLMDDDVTLFLHDEHACVKDTPSWKALRDCLHGLQSVTKEKVFPVDVTTIDWGNLVPPQKATVLLNISNPRYGTVRFDYESEDGDVEEVLLTFDSKKEIIGWNFINEPSTLPIMRDTLLVAMYAALQQVYMQKRREKEQQSQKKHTEPVACSSQTRVLCIQDFVDETRVKVKTRPSVIPEESAEMPLSSACEGEGKVCCIAYDEDKLVKELKRLASVDVELVRAAIEKFDPSQKGAIKAIRSVRRKRGKVYSLRVESRIRRGGIRILLSEERDENERRYFQVIRMGYREELFRMVKNLNEERYVM